MQRKIADNNNIDKEINKHFEKGDDGHDHSSWLYIRALLEPGINNLITAYDDLGNRPFSGSNLIAYLSPGIVVDGSQANLDLAPNIQHTITIEVKNGGAISVSNAFLRLYWTFPTTGFNISNCNQIGNTHFVTVPSYSSCFDNFLWTPLNSGSGHCCVCAQVESYNPDDHSADLSILDTVNDRHVAQKNIHVIHNFAQTILNFGFIIGSPAKGGRYRIQAREVMLTNTNLFNKPDKMPTRFSKKPLSISLFGGEVIKELKQVENRFGVLKEIEEKKTLPISFNMKYNENRLGNIRLERQKGDKETHLIFIEMIEIKTNKVVGGFGLVF